MPIEREKKFLFEPKHFPKDLQIPVPEKIKQGYVIIQGNREVRIRIYNDKDYEVCIKIRDNTEVCKEFSIVVNSVTGLPLWENSLYQLSKDRIYVDPTTHPAECVIIDTYKNGLQVVEVEYSEANFDEVMEFVRGTSWIGDEITGMEEYSNIHIAKNKLSI